MAYKMDTKQREVTFVYGNKYRIAFKATSYTDF